MIRGISGKRRGRAEKKGLSDARQRKTGVLGAIVLIVFASFIGIVTYQAFSSNSSHITVELLKERKSPVLDSNVDKPLPTFIKEQDEELSTASMIEEAQQSVYTIVTTEEQGSGFLYNNEGHVITSAHVINDSAFASVIAEDDTHYEATVEGTSEFMDVAVLYVPELDGFEPFPLETDQQYGAGEDVLTIGSPEGMQNTVTYGEIITTEENLLIEEYEYEDLYEISADIIEGSSGGPLISENDQAIIGMNAARTFGENAVGYSVPLYKLEEIIEDLIS
ncbi:trypsin-like peptidase domain-containing protein [Salipaludibacillus agaradhaerens]|uniref:Trypsin-like peptidase domain-containing protein n=1 Tax=Salipaludibacillus agaradhaerens TaxID=76935 RepID=A0A9Q4FUM3_SALAG|nr:serine protease [Salipaludibacillus agaradhaerens]MCR6094980.1 trypsin-like peptidase domain-containing protein [Salipaludibacillus agaradhaerens]MCR6115462.1 trypsin-like peptidase domain-containing protein [Salipaludibacillus agaradhaerens]